MKALLSNSDFGPDLDEASGKSNAYFGCLVLFIKILDALFCL